MSEKTLYQKILQAQEAIVCIKPDMKITSGPNKGHKYASKAGLLSAVQESIYQAGLVISTSMKRLDKDMVDGTEFIKNKQNELVKDSNGNLMTRPIKIMIVTATMQFNIRDTESSECDSVTFIGLASDKLSMADQTPQKAETAAIRMFYSDYFQAPILEGGANVDQKEALATRKQKADINKLIKELDLNRKDILGLFNLSASFADDDAEYKQAISGEWERMKASKAVEVMTRLQDMSEIAGQS